jgi:hypothetical protein
MFGGTTDERVSPGKADALNECVDAGGRANCPSVKVGRSTSAASKATEGLNRAGRRRGPVIAAAGRNEAVANSLYSTAIHTLSPVARNRQDPCPDQISVRPSVGVRSSQASWVHPRKGIAMSLYGQKSRLRKPQRGRTQASPATGTDWPPSPLDGADGRALRHASEQPLWAFQPGIDLQFAISHPPEANI